MTKAVFPYQLQEGQIAYAVRVMADLNALADKWNQVALPGMEESDLGTVLLRLKALLDQQGSQADQAIESFSYDSANHALVIRRRDGGSFSVPMAELTPQYQALDSDSIDMELDAANRISGSIRNGSVSWDMLAAALQTMLNGMVEKDDTGNADEIVFSDGDTVQEKLDRGLLHGRDGVSVALSTLCYFRVDSNGHLYVGVAEGSAEPPFSLNGSGHLIYRID